jgi:hypothetical protein
LEEISKYYGGFIGGGLETIIGEEGGIEKEKEA